MNTYISLVKLVETDKLTIWG